MDKDGDWSALQYLCDKIKRGGEWLIQSEFVRRGE